MSSGISAFFHSKAGRSVAVGTFVVGIAIAGYSTWTNVGTDTPDAAYYSTYVCTETGKSFRHRNRIGEVAPILSPYSGKKTGLPAEACYWTASGAAKEEPTWVLLNEQVGKAGPTFCPDCGRLVVGHNPKPTGTLKAPPKQSEWDGRAAAARQ